MSNGYFDPFQFLQHIVMAMTIVHKTYNLQLCYISYHRATLTQAHTLAPGSGSRVWSPLRTSKISVVQSPPALRTRGVFQYPCKPLWLYIQVLFLPHISLSCFLLTQPQKVITISPFFMHNVCHLFSI